MAHIFALLLMSSKVEKDVLDEYVRELFLPFADEYNFPPLTYPCDCNGLEESIKFANKSTRHFHQYWRSYNLISPTNRPVWNNYIQEWETALLSFRADMTPDPDCDRCQGSGYFCSNYFPLNMYDYWHGLKGDDLGSMSELKTEWKTFELPKGKEHRSFWLIAPSHKPFMFYNVVAPDGLPYRRWDYTSEEQWYEAWQALAQQWQSARVVRCLVHK